MPPSTRGVWQSPHSTTPSTRYSPRASTASPLLARRHSPSARRQQPPSSRFSSHSPPRSRAQNAARRVPVKNFRLGSRVAINRANTPLAAKLAPIGEVEINPAFLEFDARGGVTARVVEQDRGCALLLLRPAAAARQASFAVKLHPCLAIARERAAAVEPHPRDVRARGDITALT